MNEQTPERLRADFDRIARLPGPGLDHNSRCHDFLLSQLPPRVGEALEVGSGKGEFSLRLAGRSGRVLGLDLSPEMVRTASERAASAGCGHVSFEAGDFLEAEFEPGRFDAVVSIATLHHVPLAPALQRLAGWLRPGGVLAVLDLYRSSSASDRVLDGVSVVLNPFHRLWSEGRLRPPAEVRAAWQAHGVHDRYPTVAEVREAAGPLPGARVRRHLFWRYSLVWTRPAEG
ncbi:MAG: methyltransferase domain-containing protein [Isosphaeraceae bacterium]